MYARQAICQTCRPYLIIGVSNFYDKFTNTFDQQAFLDSQLAEQASFHDLNPEPHFSEAEENRARDIRIASPFINAGGLSSGTYRVDLHINGALLASGEFTVQ